MQKIKTSYLNHIIELCRQQERAAQQKLYVLYIERMYNAALRYGKDKATTEDLVHDSFIKIFQQIKNFRGDAKNVLGWMLRILINEALQKYRRNKRIDFVAELPDDNSLDGEAEVLSQMASEEIWDLIKTLREEEQLIINLAMVDQLSHKEISELLDITPSHSRTRLTRAKQALKLLIIKQNKLSI